MAECDWYLLLAICQLFFIFSHAVNQTDPDDVTALLALREHWSSNNPQLSSWQGSNPCYSKQPWLGVNCNGTSHVESLALPNMNLVGTLPIDIGNLKHLKRLDLSFNVNLTGILHAEIGNLTNLQSLVLQWCGFSGKIPSELGRLSNLTFLFLNGNYLSGPLPHEIGLLSKLYWLDVSSNQLTGQLPISAEIGYGLDNLTDAEHFHLNNNSFDGVIPASIFHEEMEIEHLLLDANRFVGPIPDELRLLTNIAIIKLSSNNLSGKIPDGIANLTTLTNFEVDHNSFSETPPDLSPLTNLSVLDLSQNTFSEMDVPSWITNLLSLNSLFMSNANLHGELPSDILSLPMLRIVTLSNNSINGTLDFPVNIGKQLEYIYLGYNNISDTIRLNLYNKSNVLELQGNPACINLASSYCRASPPLTSDGNGDVCNLTKCASPLILNPELCLCAVPYKGVYIFRAPQFKALNNNTDFSDLSSMIANYTRISIKQVVMVYAYFDYLLYLNVWYHLFPMETEYWTQEEVYALSYILSSSVDIDGVPEYPSIYGPPQFRPLPYQFPEEEKSNLRRTWIVVISVVVPLVAIIVAVSFYAILQKKRADLAQQRTPFASWPESSRAGEGDGPPHLKGARCFSLSELNKATDNFSVDNEIGVGGYGKVYKGLLLSGDQVAIKRAHQYSFRGVAEFKTEIELLSRVHHKNLVGLIGFCFEQGEQMLIYEYMANGTVRNNLLGQAGVDMDWGKRIMVALGAAKGLAYLHEMANPPIIHRDIKSANILLDDKNIAKVADFGLGKIMQAGDDDDGKGHVSTQVKGTMGYLDPEYYMTQQLTEKSDVYSFGVVLLELLTARLPIEKGKYIVREVKAALDKGGIPMVHLFLDPNLHDLPPGDLNKFLNLALSCLKDTRESRPSMNEVVKELEGLAGTCSLNNESDNDVKQLYSPHSIAAQKVDMDSSFQYSGGYMVPTIVEPK